MKPALVCLLMLATSCATRATLFTDSVFRAAAPEILEAWSRLAPLRPAGTAELPRDAFGALQTLLPKTHGTALIGAPLTLNERTSLVTRFPGVRLVFFVPPADAAGAADVTVDRDAAWAAVAEKAAAVHTAATALFPADVTPDELDRFERSWRAAGGGTLTSVVWPVTSLAGNAPLFQWAGTAAEALVRGLPSGRVVHTDPGLDGPPESTGLTWRIRREGLEDFLWKAASDNQKTVYFLPVEAVPIDRG